MHRWVWLALAVAAAAIACGESLKLDDPLPSPDAEAPPPTTSNGDAGDAAPVECDPTARFKDPRAVDGLQSKVDEGHARFSSNELVVYFDRLIDSGSRAVFRATRNNRNEAFSQPEPIAGLPTGAIHMTFNDSEDLFFFVVIVGSSFQLHVHAKGKGGLPTILPSSSSIRAPYLLGNELYVDEAVPAGGLADLRVAEVQEDAGLGPRLPIVAINSTGYDADPVLSFDRLSLYFYSERDPAKKGVWVAHRDTPASSWRTPEFRPEFTANDAGYTAPSWISPDNCRLYLYSTQTSGTGQDIVVAEREHGR